MFKNKSKVNKSEIIVWAMAIGIVLVVTLIGLLMSTGIYYVFTRVAGIDFELKGLLTYLIFFAK